MRNPDPGISPDEMTDETNQDRKIPPTLNCQAATPNADAERVQPHLFPDSLNSNAKTQTNAKQNKKQKK